MLKKVINNKKIIFNNKLLKIRYLIKYFIFNLNWAVFKNMR